MSLINPFLSSRENMRQAFNEMFNEMDPLWNTSEIDPYTNWSGIPFGRQRRTGRYGRLMRLDVHENENEFLVHVEVSMSYK